MTLALSGHPVVRGIAVGQAHIIRRNELDIGEYRIEPGQTEREIKRLHQALDSAGEYLADLATRVGASAGNAAEEIVRTHIAMLSDDVLSETASAHIRDDLCNAEWALQLYLEGLLAEFSKINDPYIRSRGEDAIQVVQRVQAFLTEQQPLEPLAGVPDRLGKTLVIAAELTPGELAALHERGVAGVVTEHGSPHSHTAILARNFGIPTVMGAHKAQTLIREGEPLVLDGHYGVVFASPEESIHKHYLHKQAESHRFIETLESFRERAPRSLDQVDISLMANAERIEDMTLAIESGAQGIGLFRTEFMFLQGRPPDEETQYRQLLAALDAIDNGPLVVRTLDLGADKGADLLDFDRLRGNPNPALGLRAVRLCLRELDLFKTQLKAILRASAHGPISCLIPMLTSASEVDTVRNLLAESREELHRNGQPYNESMPLGGMIEVPAAALALESLSRNLDFLSIGTNDLIQYALATDRVDEQVAHLYDPQHPGIVNLLLQIFQAARELDMPVSVCGELAGDRRFTRLLLALGLREFSMSSRNLLEVKQVICETDVQLAIQTLDEWTSGAFRGADVSLADYLDQAQSRRPSRT